MELTAKNIHKFNTYDGYAWSADFYLNGKKIGNAQHQGSGGEVEISGINTDALVQIEAYAATLPHLTDYDMDIPQDAAMVLEDVMLTTLEMRSTKRLLKAKVVADLGNGIYEWKVPSGRTIKEVATHIIKKHSDAIILNNMPLEKAHSILHPTA